MPDSFGDAMFRWIAGRVAPYLPPPLSPPSAFDFADAFQSLEIAMSKITDALNTLATDVADATAAADVHIAALQAHAEADAAKLAELNSQLDALKAELAGATTDEPAALAQISTLQEQIDGLTAKIKAADPTDPAVIVGPPDTPPTS